MPLYNVRAPNGKLYQVEGPDNADPNFLISSARQMYEQEEDRRLRREYGPGLLGTVGESIGRGVEQLKTTFGDVIPAMAGKALGFEDYAARQMQEAQEAQQRIQAEYPSMFGSYKEVQTPYEALQFGAEVIGEQIPNIATAVIPGLGGSTLAGRAAVGALTKEAAKRGLTGEAAQAFITEGVKRAANTGVNAGAFLGSYALNAPEIFQNIYEETGQMEVGASMLFSVGAAALDSILPAQLAKNISGPLKVGIVEKVLEKSGMEPSLLRSVSAGLMKGVAGEGLTEGAQEAISITAEKFVAENPQVFGSKEWDRIMEAGVRGAIAGGGFGATGASVQRLRERAEEKRVAAEQAEQQQRYEEAAKLRSEVEQAEQEIAAVQKAGTSPDQLQLFDVEPPPVYTEFYTPEEQPEQPSGQVEMFTEEGTLTPAAEKMATKDEKAAANRARQEERRRQQEEKAAAKQARQEEQRRLKEEKESRKRLLGAEQLTLPGLSEGELAARDAQDFLERMKEAEVRDLVEATGQGDLFAGSPTTASTTEPTVETEPQVRKNEPIVGTVINKDLAVLRKALGVRGNTPNALRLIAGKDLSDPTQAQDVKNILEAYANTTKTQGAADKIAEFLARPEFNVAPTQPEPTGQETQPTTEKTDEGTGFGGQPDTGATGTSVPDVSGSGAEPEGSSYTGDFATADTGGLGESGDVAGRDTGTETGDVGALESEAAENWDAMVGDKVPFANLSGIHKQQIQDKFDAGTLTREDVQWVLDAHQRIERTKAANERHQEATKGKEPGDLFLPKYTGPVFDARQQQLAQDGNLTGLLDNLISKSTAPELKRVLQKIRSLGLKTKIVVGKLDNAAGSYASTTDTITLDPVNGMNEHTAVHEILHAAISHVLRNPNLPVTKQLTVLFTQLQNQLGGVYGAQDLQEFAAELVGNPEFQALLKTMKAPRSGNMFSKFMQVLAEFFGFSKGSSAYDRGLQLISDALDISNDVEPNVGDLLFLGTPNGAAMGFNVIGKVSKSMPTLAGRAVEATRNYLSNMPDDIRALGMGLLRIDNIADIYQKDLPSIKKLLEFTEKRTGMQQQMIEQVNNNYMRFEKVAKKFPKQMEKMYAFAIDSRLAQVDVLNPEFKPSQENIAEYTRLKNVFNSLPSDVQQVYKDIRKDYVVAIKQYEDILLNSVQDPSARRKLEAQYRARQTQVAYVPFLRRGDYWVEYDENGERAVRAFESKREREMFIAKNLQGKPHRAYQNINEATFTQGSLPPSSFVVKVMEALSKENASEQLKANVYQAYLTLFPAESLAKRAMKADLVRGMETDLVQGYGETMIKWARRLATSQYAPQIDIALREIADQGRKASEDPNKAGAVTAANNILQQSQFILNPTYGGMVNALTTFSYFTFIAGNISSALINLTTLPMFSYPVLGGEHGFDKAAKALAEGSKVTTNYIFNNKVPPKYEALFRALNDRAQLEHTQAREVLEGHRAKTGDYLGVKARVMDAISIPFAKGEVLNRGATSVAAYDLALSSGMSQADAIEYAVNINKKINTSGLSATAPKYMQHPLGRVFFTFKTFVWNHAFVTARAFHQAFKGESPEVRRVALRQLLGIYGMSASFAGILGLPFIGMATTLANMIAALGDDEDEPFDAKLELREFFGEFLSKGVINYTTNLEIANRVGAADLLFRDDPQSVADHGYVRTALGQIFGPAASFAIGVERGANLMADGHVVRGIEYMLPSFIRNVVKAGRFGQEGILNTKGEPIIDDISAYNLAMQVVGFSPANLSSTYEEIGLKKEYEREVMQRRTKLLNKYDMAKRSGDYELLQEAKEDIRNFNASRKDPRARITEDTLRRSERAREAAERESVNGIRYNRALKSEIDEILSEE